MTKAFSRLGEQGAGFLVTSWVVLLREMQSCLAKVGKYLRR